MNPTTKQRQPRRTTPHLIHYALSAAMLTCAASAEGGTIFLDHFATTPTTFTSTWTWSTGGGPIPGNWATDPLFPAIAADANWTIQMDGFGGLAPNAVGDLRDTSAHLVGPHAGDIAPNALSFLDYPGATLGVGPVLSFFDHPTIGHFDVFELTTVRTGQFHVNIEFNGWHDGDPVGEIRVPEPSSVALLGLGGLMLTRRRQRSRKVQM